MQMEEWILIEISFDQQHIDDISTTIELEVVRKSVAKINFFCLDWFMIP